MPPTKQQQVLSLYQQGIRQRDIIKITGVKKDTVASYIFRSKVSKDESIFNVDTEENWLV